MNICKITGALIIFLSNICESTNTNSCSREEMTFAKKSNFKLDVNVTKIIFSKDVTMPEDCLGSCRASRFCKSFNVELNDTNQYRCDFLKVNHYSAPKESLKQKSTSTYFEIKTISECKIGVSKDCQEIYNEGGRENGEYTVLIQGIESSVFCDMSIPPYGYTLIQKRFDGSVNFYQDWLNYKQGFGNISQEFWLGNDLVHSLTDGNINKLRIDFSLEDGSNYFAIYDSFNVGDESEKYKLTVGNFNQSSNVADYLNWHNNTMFTTKDNDNDFWSQVNCAVKYNGGFWYNTCFTVNLNGPYVGLLDDGWLRWKKIGNDPNNRLIKTEIKITTQNTL